MEGDHGAQTPGEWSGLQAIATLTELNTRCFAMLAKTARGEAVAADCSLYRDLDLWRRVDQRSCERAGGCPVLLLNLNFENHAWWKRVCREPFPACRQLGRATLVQEDQARALLRDILMSIWRLGDALPTAANLLFGLAPGVSEEISNVSASDLERMAIDHAGDLRPRWEENRVFWTNLLEAAIGVDDEALFNVSLHCWQLLGRDFELR